MKHTYETGGMWEESAFTISVDHPCQESIGGSTIKPCKHCHSEKKEGGYLHWICPKVVIAVNEGGYNSTGVCVDCILEACENIGAKAS
jgi:hypothetical protein